MKTGKAAKIFGIDIKTVQRWTDDFAEFFSPEARGEGRTQRSYNPQDMIVLNTIMGLRAKRAEAEEIRAKLASGDLDTTLPPEATSIPGESAIVVYTRVKQLELALTHYQEQVEQLRADAQSERERYESKIEGLHEQIGELKAELKFLKQQDKE